MDEKSFRAMLDASGAKRQRNLELAHERSQRRENLLARALQTNRVRVDYQQVDPNSAEVQNPRAYFEHGLARLLKNRPDPTEAELETFFED